MSNTVTPSAGDPARPSVRDVLLRDGTSLRLRQAMAEDADQLLRFLEHLSADSLYYRFRGVQRLDRSMVARYFTSDGARRISLVATAAGQIVAVGTMDRLRNARTAEVAFAV